MPISSAEREDRQGSGDGSSSDAAAVDDDDDGDSVEEVGMRGTTNGDR